jgi:phage protein D
VPIKNEVPDLAVLINGAELPAHAYADLIDLQVQDDTEALSACTIAIAAWDDQRVSLAWVDDERFAVGGGIEIKLGYVDALASVFKGEITGIELELGAGQVPRFVVQGYDRRHRLLRGSRMRTFTRVKDSDIAAQVARDNGLSADVVDSKLAHDYVLQDGQSDLDFLRGRAAGIGYEVVVDDKKLGFRPVASGGRARLVLQVDADVTELSLRLTARDQVGRVEVRGWDPDSKKEIVGKAGSGDEASMGEHGGPKTADQAFGKATLHLVDSGLSKQDAADKVALAMLEKLALAFVQAEGSCPGRTDLRAGTVVDLQGAGKRFSGNYYLTSVTHHFAPKAGYKTSFSGRRNAT